MCLRKKLRKAIRETRTRARNTRTANRRSRTRRAADRATVQNATGEERYGGHLLRKVETHGDDPMVVSVTISFDTLRGLMRNAEVPDVVVRGTPTGILKAQTGFSNDQELTPSNMLQRIVITSNNKLLQPVLCIVGTQPVRNYIAAKIESRNDDANNNGQEGLPLPDDSWQMKLLAEVTNQLLSDLKTLFLS